MKLDLQESRLVSKERALEIAKSEAIDEYIECSAKTEENVARAFETLTRLMLLKSHSINVS